MTRRFFRFLKVLPRSASIAHWVGPKISSRFWLSTEWAKRYRARTPVELTGDRHVRAVSGWGAPGVFTDRIGVTALRCAGLVARLAATGMSVDRAGLGAIAEVYPAGSLRIWGLHQAGYRTSRELRADLTDQLVTRAPWFDLGDSREQMRLPLPCLLVLRRLVEQRFPRIKSWR